MFGRTGIGPRLVVLAMVAATLLSAWMPAARACACAPAAGTVRPATPEPAPVCPCCVHQPADGAPRACCRARDADEPADSRACRCGPLSRPGSPEPTAPPRPADSDDSNVLTADVAPTANDARPPAGPSAAEVAVRLADPPPMDLVISLSRLTC